MTNFELIGKSGPQYLADMLVEGPCAWCSNKSDDCNLSDASVCSKRVKEWLDSQAYPDLTDDERRWAMWARRFGYNWIVRNRTENLALYGCKPDRESYGWHPCTCSDNAYVINHRGFKFIKSSDKTPVRLADLIGTRHEH